jgi:hypothetical protein
MGVAPPVDLPTPTEQAGADASVGFAPSPTGPSICGFAFPSFQFQFNFRLPKFPPFDFPPKFNFFFALNCDLSDPLDAQFAFGGGRVSTGPNPDEDPEFGTE